jgi:DNA-binding transcriptional MerR regulator
MMGWENGYIVSVGQIGFDAHIKQLKQQCELSLMWQGLSDEERQNIEKWNSDLDKAIEEIKRVLEELPHHNAKDYALLQVNKLMRVSFNIGARASLSKTTARFLKSHQASQARRGRQPKNAHNKQQLQEAILEVAVRSDLKDSDKYAESIKDAIHAKVGKPDGWPSNITIRRAIRIILKG